MNMSQRTIAIALVVFFLIVGGLYLVFSSALRQEGGGEKSLLSDFFPFGRGGTTDGADGGGAPDGVLEEGEELPAPVFRKISAAPVAGASLFTRDGKTVIRFIESETGHVYETSSDSLTQTRISNTTIPRIQEAVWFSSGEELIIRYLDEDAERVINFAARINSSQEEGGALAGTFLSSNIVSLAISPDGKTLFSVKKDNGGAAGLVSNPDGSREREVWRSPISQWHASWPNASTVSLLSKPASSVFGYLYFLQTASGSFTKVVGDIPGLTASVSPDLSFVLLGASTGNGIELSALERKSGEITRFTPPTLPEKCAWSRAQKTVVICGVPHTIPAAPYPDRWYQGFVSFSDAIWKFDIAAGTANLLFTPRESEGEAVDIISPLLSEDGTYFLFRNKKDSSLWGLQLPPATDN